MESTEQTTTPQTNPAPTNPPAEPTTVSPVTTQVTQPAKKKSSIGLILVIVAIVGLVMIACCAISASVLFVARNKIQSNRQIDYNYINPTDSIDETEAPTPTVETSALGKVSAATYTFYFPKTFTPTTTPSTLQSYQSTKANSLGLYNTIKLNVTEKPEGSGDIPECYAYANQLTTIAFSDLTSKGNIVTAVSGTTIDRNDMLGCDMRFQVSSAKSSYFTEITMVYKTDDTKLYIIGVSYDSKDSAEYEALQDAKNAFVIK